MVNAGRQTIESLDLIRRTQAGELVWERINREESGLGTVSYLATVTDGWHIEIGPRVLFLPRAVVIHAEEVIYRYHSYRTAGRLARAIKAQREKAENLAYAREFQ